VKFIFALTIAALSLTLSLESKAAAYSMVDLEALEKEQSFDEFFAHALDIRPSERSDYWKTMVQNMGEGLLKSLLNKNRLERADYQQMEELAGWSVLKTHEFFRLKRQELAMRWFTQCFNEDATAGSPCWQDVVTFWEVDRQEPDLAGRLLALLSPRFPLSVPEVENPAHRARTLVTPLFLLKPVIRSPLAELQCKKPEVQQVVWESLRQDWLNNIKGKPFSTVMNELAHRDCWPALIPTAHAQWLVGADTDSLTLSYLLLKSQQALTPLEKDLFQVHYLLGSPARGETFNLAWNRVQELAGLPLQREAIMGVLKKWHPLPGNLFMDLDLAKRRTVARHLQRYFPEYLDFYARTCVDFFGGKRRFPQGNPATNCHELFELAGQEKGLLPVATVETFKQSL